MDWTQQFDGYCERADFTFWAEPINAITNAALILAAVIMARRTQGNRGAQILCLILFLIGIGSFLFHTFATAWAAVADVSPILTFILVYLFLVNRDVVGWSPTISVIGTMLFVPYAAVVVAILNFNAFLAISNYYWSVPLLLVIYAVALWRAHPETTRGFVVGAVILCISITLRSLDMQVCDAFPLGTHFTWHILNAIMLGYMIHVYHRHVLAGRQVQR